MSIDTSVGRVDSVQKCPKVSKCQLTLVSKCRAGAQQSTGLFFYERAQLAPYELTHVRASPGDCMRLAGRKRHARIESSEALAELPAVARTAVELHGCCARVSLAAALLSKHIDGVARAGSAGTKSGSRARSLVLLTMLAPVVENRTVEGPARARRRRELGNRRPLYGGQLSSPPYSGRRFANFRRQRGPAGP